MRIRQIAVEEENHVKFELDEESKILGTYKVRKHGIVSGLTKYEGEEVLIILLPPTEDNGGRGG